MSTPVPVPDWQKRVIDERDALNEKAKNLHDFLQKASGFNDPFNADKYKIPREDHDLLLAQWYAMMAYIRILDVRISRFGSSQLEVES